MASLARPKGLIPLSDRRTTVAHGGNGAATVPAVVAGESHKEGPLAFDVVVRYSAQTRRGIEPSTDHFTCHLRLPKHTPSRGV